MPDYVNFLAGLSRTRKILLQMVFDTVLVAFSFIAAMALRLESLGFVWDRALVLTLLAAIIVTLGTFMALGLYRALVRFVTGRVLVAVSKGAMASAVTLYVVGLGLDAGLPRSVPIIHAVFVFLTIGGVRFMARQMFRKPDQIGKKPVIIYGAGESGLQLLNSLYHGRDYLPVAMVDDNKALQNLMIGGLRVYSPDALGQLITRFGVQVVLLAIPSMGRKRRREVVAALEDLQIEIKTIPGMSDIISGKAEISELRSVTPEDLLGRDPVAPDPALLGQNVTGKVVMVSGAGGSIGSELCRQLLGQEPETLVLYEVSEFALYTIESELCATKKALGNQTKIVPILGSVQHRKRLGTTIGAFGV
ncbi:MAG: polysaccharide biosynthesis protein, partial [Rhodobacteraceae bacterium]|nr:polysaccharide biosynthesis protein [Paracoccaceae bacterium]